MSQYFGQNHAGNPDEQEQKGNQTSAHQDEPTQATTDEEGSCNTKGFGQFADVSLVILLWPAALVGNQVDRPAC